MYQNPHLQLYALLGKVALLCSEHFKTIISGSRMYSEYMYNSLRRLGGK